METEMETEMEKGRQNYQLLYIVVQLKMEEIYGWYGAIGHNVKMPDLPNHKFPNPTHYVQVHLKSATLTFSALTSYTDPGLSLFVEHSFFSIMHMLVFCNFTN